MRKPAMIGRDDALLRRHAGGNAECDGKRRTRDTDDDTRHQIGCEKFFRVIFGVAYSFGLNSSTFICNPRIFILPVLVVFMNRIQN